MVVYSVRSNLTKKKVYISIHKTIKKYFGVDLMASENKMIIIQLNPKNISAFSRPTIRHGQLYN